ncbi:AraC family transcriptional regulator [Bifidobacterium aemilianum]|uniref:AraC family transcriptional regulator n=1 Tax=Bifidobacterium aemilianum TaxID=2493120 RepID=A0A366K7B4_9BIFI|nr:AraC family transcriptional regulator [Bifidobacterium aemilianum]RBP97626.1 AraC family transcriptional regulator [Bifidobacterium aemilianum]
MVGSIQDRGALEVILPERDQSIGWRAHGFPSALARWHYHAEVEFHLIRQGTGYMMAGDGMVPFESGQVTMMGSNLPHNWISALAPGESLPRRDVLCQVHPNQIRALSRVFPEAGRLQQLLVRSERAIVLKGGSALRARAILEDMGQDSGFARLQDLLSLLEVFMDAPRGEWFTVVTPDFNPDNSTDAAERINTSLKYISDRVSRPTSLEEAAAQVAMSPAAFSRFFKKTTGINFSQMVRRIKIARACRLLVSTDKAVSAIQKECGYGNAANFNRRFRQEIGLSPSQYRRLHCG